jgi:hypothetical protein
LNGIHNSGPVKCQLKMTNVQGDQARGKRHKMLKNASTHPQRPSLNNPWAHRHHWDQLWSLPGDLNRKFEHVLYCSLITTAHLPTHPSAPQEFVTNNMVIVSHPPYSADLGPCDFAVSQIENETEGMMFWNSIWHPKGIANSTWQHWGKWLPRHSWSMKKWIGSLYLFPRRLFWKRWQTKLSMLSQHLLFWPSLGTSGYTSYSIHTR